MVPRSMTRLAAREAPIGWRDVLLRALVSGTAASVTSSLALALLARGEGRGALQPVNATSHWRHGPAAASVERFDLAHTVVGYATHHAATVFWAGFFEAWVGWRQPRAGWPLVRDAMLLSAIAAAVDYGITPKRFTPGWEFVLSARSMAVAYAAMGAGLAARELAGASRR